MYDPGAVQPEQRITRSELTKHWIVDGEPNSLGDRPLTAQGFRNYDDALAEANQRTAHDLRFWARHYEGQAQRLASEPELLNER